MALMMWPTLLELQRIFRRIRHNLILAFACSPGPRSLACSCLAWFYGS